MSHKIMSYKGYSGSVEFSKEDNLFFGEVLGIRSLISYEGKTEKELEKDFREAIRDYLSLCKKQKIKPEKSYQGSLVVGISPEIYEAATISALEKDVSISEFVENALAGAINKS